MPTLTDERYVPAAGRAWLTALYDPLMALTMRERAFRPALIAAVFADPRPSLVLDLGCGTGTLASQLAEADPSVRVLGIDGDEDVLAHAREKVTRFGERVRFKKAWQAACRSMTHRSPWWSPHCFCTTSRQQRSWKR